MAIELSGSSGVIGPIWTTATRPSNAVAGQQGFNTTTGLMDLYNGTSWTSIGVQNLTPIISTIIVTNNTYTNLDDTALDTAGGYIKIFGFNFVNGCQVLVNTTSATSTTFVSSTEIRAQIPATAAGTYTLYVVNPDGGTATRVNGITFSVLPAWQTSSTLATQNSGTAFSLQLSATDATSYSLAAGSTLPTGASLSSAGVLSGTVTVANSTTYNFSVQATDAQLQDSIRAFSILISNAAPRNLVGNGSLASDPLSASLYLALPFSSSKGGSDLSGNGRNATANGNPAFNTVPSPANTVYQSAYGPGNDSNFYYISSSTLNMKALMTLTVECWIYVNSGSAAASILNYYSSQSEGGFALDVTSRYIYSNAYQGYNVQTANNVWNFNTWHHVVYQRYSDTHEIYLDGTRLAQSTSSNYGSSYSFNDILKSRWGGQSPPFPSSNCYIQDLRIYTVRKYTGSTYDKNAVQPILTA